MSRGGAASGTWGCRTPAGRPGVGARSGFTLLEMVVALAVFVVGLALAAGVLVESHRMLAQVGVELRAPEVEGGLDLLRAELQGAAGVSGGPVGGGPGWSRDRLVLVRPDGAMVVYERDGRRLVRRWNGAGEGRTVVPRLVSWRWHRVGPNLVTAEVVWEAGGAPGGSRGVAPGADRGGTGVADAADHGGSAGGWGAAGMVKGPGVSSGERRGESGQGLVIALLALLLLGAVFALVAGMLVTRMQRAQEDARETVLLALADAAVAESLANLAAHPVSAGVERRPFGGGTIESVVTRTGGRGFRLTAVATYRGETLTVEAVGRLTELGPVVDSWRRVPAAEADGGGGSFGPARSL